MSLSFPQSPKVFEITIEYGLTSLRTEPPNLLTTAAETDVAVSTLVSVRDRVIQAYEDIMKMPI